MNILHLICAILLPPLGVFLKEGVNKNFWIALVLTFFFWIPESSLPSGELCKNKRLSKKPRIIRGFFVYQFN